jgi:hypothetical protein
LLSLPHILVNKITHPLVTPLEHRGIVIVSYPLVVHHVLKITDNCSGPEIPSPGRNKRLVHVKSDGTGTLYTLKRDSALIKEHRFIGC